jgi:hypothetical protein
MSHGVQSELQSPSGLEDYLNIKESAAELMELPLAFIVILAPRVNI